MEWYHFQEYQIETKFSPCKEDSLKVSSLYLHSKRSAPDNFSKVAVQYCQNFGNNRVQLQTGSKAVHMLTFKNYEY